MSQTPSPDSIHQVGFRKLVSLDHEMQAFLPLWVFYPTATQGRDTAMGPFRMKVTEDSPVEGRDLPIVVISHGSGGTQFTHRILAAYLAARGFVVALPLHSHNHRLDNVWAGQKANLEARPRAIRLALTMMRGDGHFYKRLDVDRVALIGHSIGGYTALAAAGAKPKPKYGINTGEPIDPFALVLFAPDGVLLAFDHDEGLSEVDLPILMLTAEQDSITPHANAEVLVNRLPNPDRLTHRMVPNAGHLSFLSPFPTSMQDRVGMAARDPKGFDRVAFHREMNVEVFEFLRESMG